MDEYECLSSLGSILSHRDQVDKVNNGLSPLPQQPDPSKELDKLQGLLATLNIDYNIKKEAMKNTINPSNTGQ